MQRSATSKLLPQLSTASISYYKGNELTVEQTKKLLLQFKGGNINVCKNDATGIATICLNRPDKKNALSGQMLIDLDKAAEELENWKYGKGFILHGSSNIFCSGGDLAMAKGTSTPEMGYAISQFVQGVNTRFRNLPLVSVALIEGVALGGGAELCVAACDWRVMTSQARIGFVHGRMGISAGWGGGVALKRLIGPSSALELIASGRLVAAPEAVSLGLATAVLQDSSLEILEQTQQWLLERVSSTTEVLRAAKALMLNEESDQDLELERRLHAPLWGGKAKAEALEKNIKHK